MHEQIIPSVATPRPLPVWMTNVDLFWVYCAITVAAVLIFLIATLAIERAVRYGASYGLPPEPEPVEAPDTVVRVVVLRRWDEPSAKGWQAPRVVDINDARRRQLSAAYHLGTRKESVN